MNTHYLPRNICHTFLAFASLSLITGGIASMLTCQSVKTFVFFLGVALLCIGLSIISISYAIKYTNKLEKKCTSEALRIIATLFLILGAKSINARPLIIAFFALLGFFTIRMLATLFLLIIRDIWAK